VKDSQEHLKTLYPFLCDQEKDKDSENLVLLDSIKQKTALSLRVKERFFECNGQALIEAARAIAQVYRKGGRMLAMGNGGSSCDAAHFCVEFQHPVTAGRSALPATNLVMDTAMVSAIANDLGVDHIFARQLEAQAASHDGLIGFSTSGNSKNLIEAYRKARELGLVTFGLTGGDGGAMAESGLVDHCLVVESDSIHRVQEVHVTAYHILWDLVHTLLADYRGKSGINRTCEP
jgi:D-sedoheptulose 7-phosphate isomerase